MMTTKAKGLETSSMSPTQCTSSASAPPSKCPLIWSISSRFDVSHLAYLQILQINQNVLSTSLLLFYYSVNLFFHPIVKPFPFPYSLSLYRVIRFLIFFFSFISPILSVLSQELFTISNLSCFQILIFTLEPIFCGNLLRIFQKSSIFLTCFFSFCQSRVNNFRLFLYSDVKNLKPSFQNPSFLFPFSTHVLLIVFCPKEARSQLNLWQQTNNNIAWQLTNVAQLKKNWTFPRSIKWLMTFRFSNCCKEKNENVFPQRRITLRPSQQGVKRPLVPPRILLSQSTLQTRIVLDIQLNQNRFTFSKWADMLMAAFDFTRHLSFSHDFSKSLLPDNIIMLKNQFIYQDPLNRNPHF